VKAGEEVVFFPTLGRAVEGDRWRVMVHGWIYQRLEISRLRRAGLDVVKRLVGLRVRMGELEKPMFRRRLGAFLADNERGRRIVVRLGERVFRLRNSSASGHFKGEILLEGTEVEKVREAGGWGGRAGWGGWARFRAVLPAGDGREFAGRVMLLEREGVSVISDIDDTIKVTEVLQRRRMLRNTFLTEFGSVPGMAGVYAAWARDGAAFHYVSGSPWHLYPFLEEFLGVQGFPPGSFHLRDFRLMGLDLRTAFRSAARVKRRHIEGLLAMFPGRRFVLVGDSGEGDAKMYAGLARQYPERTVAIYIRNVTDEAHGHPRWRKEFVGVAAKKWQVFDSAEELSDAYESGGREQGGS